jgi:hypothetical protein
MRPLRRKPYRVVPYAWNRHGSCERGARSSKSDCASDGRRFAQPRRRSPSSGFGPFVTARRVFACGRFAVAEKSFARQLPALPGRTLFNRQARASIMILLN